MSRVEFSWKKLNLANKITLLRIGAIIPILLLLAFPNHFTCWLAFLLFVAASMSDFVDGYIARREGQVTNFGKFLDPLADKLLICSVLIMMVGLGWVSAIITIIIVVRELAVTGLRAVAADNGVVIAADKFGKWKTVLQLFALAPLIIHYPFWGINPEPIGLILLYLALILTVFSGGNYFYRFYQDWLKLSNIPAEAELETLQTIFPQEEYPAEQQYTQEQQATQEWQEYPEQTNPFANENQDTEKDNPKQP